MTRRRKKRGFERQAAFANVHFDNLIKLRDNNPQAYARLGDGPHKAVENYELEQTAVLFEFRPGIERMLDLRERRPEVYARFTSETKQSVEMYLERKKAYMAVNPENREI